MNTSSSKKLSTLEQVEAWLETAAQLGYKVRHDHFGGTGGGVCEFGGQKWIFLDVSLSAYEQLEQLAEAIPKDPLFGTQSQQSIVFDTRAA